MNRLSIKEQLESLEVDAQRAREAIERGDQTPFSLTARQLLCLIEAANAAKWISMDEALPECSQAVFVGVVEETELGTQTDYLASDGNFVRWVLGHQLCHSGRKMRAWWMPVPVLPQP